MFQDIFPIEKRKDESNRVMNKYPDRIPCVIQKARYSKLPKILKIKYLVSINSSMADIVYSIRSRIKLEPHQSLFFMVNDSLLASSCIISQIYPLMKDDDGFLYIYYAEESTFG